MERKFNAKLNAMSPVQQPLLIAHSEKWLTDLRMIREKHDIALIANPRDVSFRWGNVQHLKDVTRLKLTGLSVTRLNPCNPMKYADEAATGGIVKNVVIAIRYSPVCGKRGESNRACSLGHGFGVRRCRRCRLRLG